LLAADALDFAINLLRRSHAAAGRVHMNNNGLDGRVLGKLLELANHRLRRQNHAVEIDHADAIAEAGHAGVGSTRMQRDVDQREYGQHEEEESSSTDQNPEQCARTSFSHAGSLAPAPLQGRSNAARAARAGSRERVGIRIRSAAVPPAVRRASGAPPRARTTSDPPARCRRYSPA